MRYYNGEPQVEGHCVAMAVNRNGEPQQCKRRGRGRDQLCYQHRQAKEVEIPPDLDAPPAPPLPCMSWPDPVPHRLSPRELAQERLASLKRQREREEQRVAEYRKEHPLPEKGWRRIKFGGTIQIGSKSDEIYRGDDTYVPPLI